MKEKNLFYASIVFYIQGSGFLGYIYAENSSAAEGYQTNLFNIKRLSDKFVLLLSISTFSNAACCDILVEIH